MNNPIYEALGQISLGEVLHFIDQQCHFMGGFTHVLDKYVKTQADKHRISACLVAFATNIGLTKMSGSSSFNRSELANTANCFIRPETLKITNDIISNGIAQLPIFEHYNFEEGIIHSSSDGQKYGTQFDTIRSRYSPKYFGLGKGISSCTLVANHVPINARIIGANEHESHFVFDLLFNNTSDIIPDRHSTDAHGSNQVNFIILYLFGYMFAPRFPKLNKKANTLYGFKHPNEYRDFLIRPTAMIKRQLIIDEWENIQKIMISLGLKSTTQSTIIRKLSSYARKNRTKKPYGNWITSSGPCIFSNISIHLSFARVSKKRSIEARLTTKSKKRSFMPILENSESRRSSNSIFGANAAG